MCDACTHNPAHSEIGSADGAHGDVPWRMLRRRLDGLELVARLRGRRGANYIARDDTETVGREWDQSGH